MMCVIFLLIATKSVNSITTGNTQTITFDQTTEIMSIHNTTTTSMPVTEKLFLTTILPTGPGKSIKGRDFFKTDAPMLNYIFDTHSSKGKHHHHDTYKWGPHFDPSETHLNGSTVTVQVKDTAVLNCKVNFLQDKMISWVRRKKNNELQLLTVGRHTYSGDERYTLEFQYPGNWRLQIKFVNKNDEGLYECQISTHPPKVTQTFLYVNAPEVVIVDEHGMQLTDKYYESDSTIQLSCIVRHVAMTSSVVLWLHGNKILNYDLSRGGISVKTELKEAGANSTLSVAKVNKTDSGNYTCSISKNEYATVAIHILNEESLAELHHGSESSVYSKIIALRAGIISFLVIWIIR